MRGRRHDPSRQLTSGIRDISRQAIITKALWECWQPPAWCVTSKLDESGCGSSSRRSWSEARRTLELIGQQWDHAPLAKLKSAVESNPS